jgi:hypothetical protein
LLGFAPVLGDDEDGLGSGRHVCLPGPIRATDPLEHDLELRAVTTLPGGHQQRQRFRLLTGEVDLIGHR